jgi:kumamolisin
MSDRTERDVDLAGSHRGPLPGARDAGPWPPDEEIVVSLLLRRHGRRVDLSGMEKGFRPNLSERVYLTRRDFEHRYGTSKADAALAAVFARQNGLQLRDSDPARRVIHLRGRPSEISQAFGVELRRFEHAGTSYRSSRAPARLPGRLAEAVTGIFGLDDRPQLRPHFRRNADPAASGYSVASVASAYAFPAPVAGARPTIGILEFGGGFAAGDLSQYFGGLGRSVPEIETVSVDGSENSPTGDPNGPDAEVELDIEIAGALAPGARIIVYFAPNTEQGFVDALTTAVHDTTYSPSVVSISWGSPEGSWSSDARSALEATAQDAATMGVTVLAASGDQGASDGGSAGMLAVDFPASSPYVLGCGGTRLELSGTTIESEVVWNDLGDNEGATGGGVSEDFPHPPFQLGAAVPAAPNGFVGRGVPDVAANADPETGYAAVVDGQAAVLGGTSAVAPLWAALIALLSESIGKPLGYANLLLYPPGAAATFRPITSGNNGGYVAGPGWNPCTGLGSPQGTSLLRALRAPSSPGAGEG